MKNVGEGLGRWAAVLGFGSGRAMLGGCRTHASHQQSAGRPSDVATTVTPASDSATLSESGWTGSGGLEPEVLPAWAIW